MLWQLSIQEAILADQRDNLAWQGKTRQTNMTAIDATDDPDYAIFMAQRDASGRLPDCMFSQFDCAAKTAWTKLPHAS